MQTNRSTPWLFLAPNMLIFGVFTFLPIAINFYYAFTGGVQPYPQDRPYVGFENLATLLDCANYLDPSSCTRRTGRTSASRIWPRCLIAPTTSTRRPASATCSGARSGTPRSTRCSRSR